MAAIVVGIVLLVLGLLLPVPAPIPLILIILGVVAILYGLWLFIPHGPGARRRY